MQLRNVPGPSRDHWRIFLTVTLRSCPQLVHVDLARNEAIASTLEPFATLHGSLQYLDVCMSAGFGGTLQPLRGFRKLRKLCLYGCVALEGTVEPLANLHDLETGDMRRALGFREASSSWRRCQSSVPQRLRHAAGHRGLRVGRLCGRADVS